jgi:ABC-2 type transport system ATP-binding protein
MANPSIETLNLAKHYNSFIAVSDLNLEIKGSKCVGLLGPNGAGKTTTLKMLTGLTRPSSGRALINGIDVDSHKKEALGSVGALIETPEIYPSLTPREALTMIAKIRGVPKPQRRKVVEKAIARVRMGEWIDRKVGKFSKGMKQRICIALTLLSDPTVLLLDEPTIGLDPRGISEVRTIIKSLKGEDRLILMSSHILNEVLDVCDYVAMIDHGKLIVYDTIPNVTRKFSADNTTVEVGVRQPIDKTTLSENIETIPGVVAAEKIDEKSIRIKFNGGLDVQQRILADMVRRNIEVISYKLASSELEEVYLKLTENTA